MTDTMFEPPLETYAESQPGVNATTRGLKPTGMVASTTGWRVAAVAGGGAAEQDHGPTQAAAMTPTTASAAAAARESREAATCRDGVRAARESRDFGTR